jgi:hypothetical protein
MKIYRILGILWLALCCFTCFNLLRSFSTIQPVAPIVWVLLVFLWAAGFGWHCGEHIFVSWGFWARWIISSLAVFMAFVGIASILTSRSLSITNAAVCAFALVTPVLILLPKREPVA